MDKRVLKRLVQGYLIGMANIIPGVSGGTMALVMGIYPRLLAALGQWDWRAARVVLRVLSLRPGAWAGVAPMLRRLDAGFLVLLGGGAMAAVFTLSRALAWLLQEHLTATYAFFFGLILASVLLPWRLLRRRGRPELAACLLAAVATVWLTASVDDTAALAKAERKAVLRADRATAEQVVSDGESRTSAAPRILWRRPPAGDAARVFLGAALAIAAMVLPGVSGSFVLLLLGVYFDMLRAVNERDVLVLMIFMAGGLVGLLALARVVDACLRRWFDVTLAAMIGLMLGSLWGLWPFKRAAAVGGEWVILGNRWPGTPGEAVTAALVAIAAVGLVLGFIWIERRVATTARPSNPYKE